jgi:CheY-like chemotaxis protein
LNHQSGHTSPLAGFLKKETPGADLKLAETTKGYNYPPPEDPLPLLWHEIRIIKIFLSSGIQFGYQLSRSPFPLSLKHLCKSRRIAVIVTGEALNASKNIFRGGKKSWEKQVWRQGRPAMSLPRKCEIILIVDDEECIRDSCCQVLRKAGYDVVTAMNGKAGLAKAREIGPDLALVDLDMPGVSGLEVMEELHEISPSIVRIVVTGNTSMDLEKEIVRKRRAQTYLTKPFSPEQLRLVVRKALDTRNKEGGL